MEIMNRFDGKVPLELLKEFVAAIAEGNEPLTGGRRKGALDRVYVWGMDPTDGTLIFLPAYDALRAARLEADKKGAKTWAEWEEISGWTAEDIGEICCYPEFEDYLGENYGDECEVDLVAVKKEYVELTDVGQRPPLGSDPFDNEEWDEFCFERDIDEFDPRKAMHGLVPGDLIEKYGSMAFGVFDGPYVEFLKEVGEDVVRGLEEKDFTVVEDQVLIDGCMRFVDVEGIYGRVGVYGGVEEVLGGVG